MYSESEQSWTSSNESAPDETWDPTSILGVNPTETQEEGEEIHEEIATRWNSFALKGIKKEDRQNLLNVYPIIKNGKGLKGPSLNSELQEVLENKTTQNVLTQDNYIKQLQNQLAAATSALAIVTSKLYTKPSEETNYIQKNLVDAGKLICDVQHSLCTEDS